MPATRSSWSLRRETVSSNLRSVEARLKLEYADAAVFRNFLPLSARWAHAMVGQKVRESITSGFDVDADFIAFDFSDDEPQPPPATEVRPVAEKEPPAAGRKRKWTAVDSSPDSGPSPQRQKLGDSNPWQSGIGIYEPLTETSGMSVYAFSWL